MLRRSRSDHIRSKGRIPFSPREKVPEGRMRVVGFITDSDSRETDPEAPRPSSGRPGPTPQSGVPPAPGGRRDARVSLCQSAQHFENARARVLRSLLGALRTTSSAVPVIRTASGCSWRFFLPRRNPGRKLGKVGCACAAPALSQYEGRLIRAAGTRGESGPKNQREQTQSRRVGVLTAKGTAIGPGRDPRRREPSWTRVRQRTKRDRPKS